MRPARPANHAACTRTIEVRTRAASRRSLSAGASATPVAPCPCCSVTAPPPSDAILGRDAPAGHRHQTSCDARRGTLASRTDGHTSLSRSRAAQDARIIRWAETRARASGVASAAAGACRFEQREAFGSPHAPAARHSSMIRSCHSWRWALPWWQGGVMRQLKHPATIISMVALFAALSGGAVAGTLVSGAQLKNHSIAANKLTAGGDWPAGRGARARGLCAGLLARRARSARGGRLSARRAL